MAGNFFDQFDAPAPQSPTTADVVARMEVAKQPRSNFFDQFDAPKINFDRPIEEVRADIAKVPEGPTRDAAMKAWADHYVAKERGPAKPEDPNTTWFGPVGWGPHGPAARGQDPRDIVRNVARGTIVGSFADELDAGTRAFIHKITGGRLGSPYEEAIAYERAKDRAIDEQYPLASGAGKISGAFGSGAPLANLVFGGAKKVLPKYLAAPTAGAVVGPSAGYVAGLGEGEGDLAQRHEHATSPGPLGLSPVELGLAAGVGLPPIFAGVGSAVNKLGEAMGPTIARAGANMAGLPRRIGITASADGAIPEGTTVGGNAAASQMLADSLRRSGKTIDEIRAAREAAATAGEMHSSGQAQDATFLADLDQGWQRAAASAGRMNPGAAEYGKNAVYARQTGITPHNALAEDVASTVGLPTAPMFARPITAPQSKTKFGTDFGAGTDNIIPMGQGARVVDALKRAFLIKDTDFHGHAANANRTDEAILASAKEAAQPAYKALYKAGDNLSIAPEVGGTLKNWTPDGEKLAREAPPVVAMVQRYVKMFAPGGNPVTHIERFDRTKQYLDGQIEKLFDSPIGRNRHAAGVLNDFKNELVAAVDAIPQNNLGALYKDTRSKWSSAMEAREMIQAGREARSNPDAALRSLQDARDSDEHLKLWRLGFLGDIEKTIGAMKRGSDATAIFDNANVQRLLSEAIPRSEKGSARFATRPETFGQYLGNTKKEIETRNYFQGGSSTQRNIKDDDAYEVLSRWGEVMQGFKSTGSLTKLGFDLVQNTFQSMFGMHADTARAIVHQLFTADPRQQRLILNDIASRMDPGQLNRLLQHVQEQQALLTAATAQQAGRP